jgi:methoxymalonate biosynthesis acyl carrier protein
MNQDADMIRDVVAAFLSSRDKELRPGPDEELFAVGLVNSLFAVELIGFLENRFGVKFGVDDLDLGNFATLNRIAQTVSVKQATGLRAGR